MRCDICGGKAAVHVTDVAGRQTRERHLCERYAGKEDLAGGTGVTGGKPLKRPAPRAREVKAPPAPAWKVIAVAGSPRPSGNSTTLLRAVLSGAVSAGAEGSTVYLNDLVFRGCQGCQPCTPDATCRLRDDLTPILARLRQADVWVLAAPIYFDGVSGQMKLFFDRLRHLINSAGRLEKQLAGPRAAAVIVTYEDKPREDYRDVAARLANYLGWMGDFDPVEVLSVGRLGPAGAAAGKCDLLVRANALGRRLVQRLAQRHPAGGQDAARET